jgi:hypothetical protein
MSHTTKIDDRWSAIHDGDYHGDIEIVDANAEFNDDVPTIPFYVMEALVAASIRKHKIRQLEDMSDHELLYGEKK